MAVGQIGVYRDGQKKHCTLECLLPEGWHSQKDQGAAENAQQQRAQHCTNHRAYPPVMATPPTTVDVITVSSIPSPAVDNPLGGEAV